MSVHAPGSSSKTGWLLFVVGFAGALVVGWFVFPLALYSSRTQPVQFSHATHGLDGAAGLECSECHRFREDGSYLGIPSLESCFECHSEIQGESQEEKRFHEEGQQLMEEGKEVPWLIYSKQPPCVYFSHIPHVNMAELACTDCHRDVTAEKVPPVYKENRITGYSKTIWDRMKMDDCGDCHEEKGVSNACFVCHK